ncbi:MULTISPECIES: hypothetical protein [unclassified Bartonella]|uniref:hypothetical protein n=1 Tax=unclassified Bartonella TaxID=2645622 RepID=UPI0035CEB1C9
MFKVASLGTAVALFLSNAAPVFSANIDLTKASLENVKNAAVVYPQSIISAYDNYNSGMDGYNSVKCFNSRRKICMGRCAKHLYSEWHARF